MFIVFEGIDGCGKDTQIDILKQYLERSNHKVKIYSNIDNGVLASEIRDYLSNGGISSYLLSFIVLANIVDTYRSIAKDIENGYTVLCSRWTMSSITYGGYKDKSQFNAAKVLKVSPYFVKDYEVAFRNYPMKKVSAIVAALRDIDVKSKGVGASSMSQHDLLKELLIKIFN